MPSRFLDLFCSQCNAHVLHYRKEGSGSLLRLYLDQIQGPDSLQLLTAMEARAGFPPLSCPQCGNRIGSPMLYEGKRPAFRLIKGSFRKKQGT